MHWEAIGAVGEVLGAIAVIITLFYLSYQLKQNTRQMESGGYTAWANGMYNALSLSLNQPHMNQILYDGWQQGEVNQDTWMPFIMWHQQYLYHLEAVWQMYKRGALDQEIFELEINRAVAVLSHGPVRQWWEVGGRNQVSPSLADKLDSLTAEQSEFTWLDWNEEEGFVVKTRRTTPESGGHPN